MCVYVHTNYIYIYEVFIYTVANIYRNIHTYTHTHMYSYIMNENV